MLIQRSLHTHTHINIHKQHTQTHARTHVRAVAVCEEQYSLTSNVPLATCPEGVITFTCVSNASPGDFRWYINGDSISHTILTTSSHAYPQTTEVSKGVTVTIVTTHQQQDGSGWFVNSRLQASLATLKPYSVACGSLTTINTTKLDHCAGRFPSEWVWQVGVVIWCCSISF